MQKQRIEMDIKNLLKSASDTDKKHYKIAFIVMFFLAAYWLQLTNEALSKDQIAITLVTNKHKPHQFAKVSYQPNWPDIEVVYTGRKDIEI